MVMQTLCEDSKINADYPSGSSECLQQASSMIFVYSIGWNLMFWSYGFPKLKSLLSINPLGASIESNSPNYTHQWLIKYLGEFFSYQWLSTVFLSPTMIGLFIGAFIGLIPVLQRGFFPSTAPSHATSDVFEGTLRPFGSALLTLGEPTICINCLVMAASLAQIDLKVSPLLRYIQSRMDTFLFSDVERVRLSPDSSSCRREDVRKRSVLIMDKSLDSMKDEGEVGKGEEERSDTVPQFRTILCHLLCR